MSVSSRSRTPARAETPYDTDGRVRGPIMIFSAFYLAFLLVLWVPLAQWMPETLEALTVSPALFGFTPPTKVILIYLTGLGCVWIGYLALKPLATNLAPPRQPYDPSAPASIWWKWTFAVAALAYAAQLYLSGAIPLFDIGIRWSLSAKLIALISLSVGLAAGAVAMWGWCRRTWLIVLGTVVALGAFGTRTLPLVLVIAVLCVTALFSSKRVVRKALLISGAGILLVMLTVGVVSKTGIYSSDQQGYQASKGIALLQTDSIGTFNNLSQVVNVTDLSGQTLHGRLFKDSLIKVIPGTKVDYANFQLGQLIGGRSQVAIGNTTINRSVSLSTTWVGPPYADNGWAGVIVFSLAVGAFWSIFEEFAVRRRWFAGFFGYWLAEMFSAIYGGGYNTTIFTVTILCIVLAVFAARTDQKHTVSRSTRGRR